VAPVQRVLRLQADAPRAHAPNLGAALRAARKASGLSLAQVAAATDISRSLLSLIETGRSDITIGRLIKLSQLYGIHVTELVEEGPPPDHAVVRKHERRHLALPDEGLDLQLLAPDSTRAFLPFTAELEPGAGSFEPVRHPGEEFVHVLVGRIRLEVEGNDDVVLEEGDSAYYKSDCAHRWINVGTQRARVLSVATPPHL
jgi:transcriptional regulator with XRE-family HTH domain